MCVRACVFRLLGVCKYFRSQIFGNGGVIHHKRFITRGLSQEIHRNIFITRDSLREVYHKRFITRDFNLSGGIETSERVSRMRTLLCLVERCVVTLSHRRMEGICDGSSEGEARN
jgi:hypothetical protein